MPLRPDLNSIGLLLLVGEVSLWNGFFKYRPCIMSFIFSSGVLFLVSNLNKSLCLPEMCVRVYGINSFPYMQINVYYQFKRLTFKNRY